MKILLIFCVSFLLGKKSMAFDTILYSPFQQHNKLEGIYYLKKIRPRDGFVCYSFNENKSIIIVSFIGSFKNITESKYTIKDDKLMDDNDGWIIIPSKLKKVRNFAKIENKIGDFLNSHGYCIYENFILHCKNS
jgi:hypothetical protein